MASTSTKTSTKPPAKAHYVRLGGPPGMRVYVTNRVLREVAPALLQVTIETALFEASGKGMYLHRHRSPNFNVRVNLDRKETHAQMASER